MEYVKLGSTGLEVSRICLGCMSYGDSGWRSWVLDEDEAGSHFRTAVEAGINFFDTADMYSRGRSEEVTGRYVREMTRRDEAVVATKVFFPVHRGPNGGGLSRKHVLDACDASLRRLGLDHVDLYQIHRFDPRTPIEETVDALDSLVRAGKVRYLGASSMAAWQFAKYLFTADRGGRHRFVSMQNHYNLVYREEEREMIPLCRDQGVGIIPWSPLARGLLAGNRSREGAEPTERARTDDYAKDLYSTEDFDVVDAAVEVAKARGVKPAQVALAWLLQAPGVTAPIVGATKIGYITDAVEALSIRLDPEEVERLEAPYRPHPVLGFRPPRGVGR
jgi:aryl-alcohol dehydrogenase-like predicted oxidoreductase